jgi:hypothetical protein
MASYWSTEDYNTELHVDDDPREKNNIIPEHTDKQPPQPPLPSSSIMGCGQSRLELGAEESYQGPSYPDNGPGPVSSFSGGQYTIPYRGIHDMDVRTIPRIDPAQQARHNDRGRNPDSNKRAHSESTTQRDRISEPGNHGGPRRNVVYGHTGSIPKAHQAQFGTVTTQNLPRQGGHLRGPKLNTDL